MKYDVITFGSGTRDIFLISENLETVAGEKFITGKGICFSAGSKIEVDDIYFTTGGGGTNTAASFIKQGLKAAWCGMVGKDFAGQKVIEEMKKIGANPSFIFKTDKKTTNYSVILASPGKERTILAFRGASGQLQEEDIPWEDLKTSWFYLAPLSGKTVALFENLVDFAQKNRIKVAVNPGNSQLSLPGERLARILKKVDILILNREEASVLTNIPFEKEKEIFKKIDSFCSGITIMTKGRKGVTVSDGREIFRAGSLGGKVLDLTGAGDSFASGFLSGFIQSKGDIEYAVQLGSANATACIQKWGAKEGLLKKNQKFKKVKVFREKC